MSKKVKLEKHKIPLGGKEMDMDEREIIYAASRNQEEGKKPVGYSYGQFQKMRRIDDALLASEKDGTLELDDQDFDFVLKNLKGGGFGLASKEYVKIHCSLVEKFEKVVQGG